MARHVDVDITGPEAHGHLNDVLMGLRELEHHVAVEVRVEPELDESHYRVRIAGRNITLSAGGRRGLIDAAHECVRRFATKGALDPEDQHEFEFRPDLPYRLFWTWDHSTNWDLSQVGQQESGAFNVYEKQPEAFLSDYRRLIAFMSEHSINGLVVYGLLRDGHGGLDTARELCAIARDYGVRLLAGIAANAYGGIYYEGQHPYNLTTWLNERPELEADFASMPGFHINDYGRVPFLRSDLSRAADSSRQENLQWTLDGVDWLLENLDVGGVNVEFGDYAGNDPLADMNQILPRIVERVRARSDDMWIVTDLGWDSLLEESLPERLAGLPEDCIYEFTFNRSYWEALRGGLNPSIIERLPFSRTVLRGQIGTQWNQQRYSHIGPDFAAMTRLARSAGMDGASMFSEVSSFSVPNEFNYLAFARFAADARLEWDSFVEQEIAPRVGGRAEAQEYLQLLTALDDRSVDPHDLRRRAREAAPNSEDEEVNRRWTWMLFEIEKRIWTASSR